MSHGPAAAISIDSTTVLGLRVNRALLHKARAMTKTLENLYLSIPKRVPEILSDPVLWRKFDTARWFLV
jgi:hypothetical protein